MENGLSKEAVAWRMRGKAARQGTCLRATSWPNDRASLKAALHGYRERAGLSRRGCIRPCPQGGERRIFHPIHGGRLNTRARVDGPHSLLLFSTGAILRFAYAG